VEFSLVIGISLAVFAALVLLAAETIREFRRMDRKTSDYTGSDRLAGSAE
jgi:hypothetical protein